MSTFNSQSNHKVTIGDSLSSRSSSRLVSTKDLPVNWENWEEHVFFGSAVSRIRTAKTYIQETFPFDGTKQEVDQWRGNLDGWQNYVLENKWAYNLRSVGFEFVPGVGDCNLVTLGGQNLISLDMENLIPLTCEAGTTTSQEKPDGISAIYNIDFSITDLLPQQRRREASKLNPKEKPLSIEFWNSLTDLTESVRGISTHRNEYGEGWTITIHVGSDGSVAYGAALTIGRNGISYGVSCGRTLKTFKNEWNHVCVKWSSASSGRNLEIIVNGEKQELINSKNDLINVNGIWVSSMLDPHWIGWSPSPQTDLSGTALVNFVINGNGGFLVDEYRVWHRDLSLEEIEERRWRNVWAQENLVLQYRFNDSVETEIFFQGTSLPAFLDSSGNQLHGIEMGEIDRSLSRPDDFVERRVHHPSLYPYDSTINANLNAMIGDAEEYDQVNPNHILKLVPSYLLESDIDSIIDNVQTAEIENENIQSSFYVAALLYTWADFWDGLKVRADFFTESFSVQPDGSGTPKPFLRIAAKELGMNLPMIFEDILPEYWDEEFDKLQEESWRRILIALPFVLKRKGTLEGIKSLFSSIGNNQILSSLRFREYGKKENNLSGETLIQQNLRFCKLSPSSVPTITLNKKDLV